MGSLLKFALVGAAGYLLYSAYTKVAPPAAGVSGLSGAPNYVRPGTPMIRRAT